MGFFPFLDFSAMINQSREQTKYCLGLSSQSNKKGHLEDDEFFEKMKKEIEVNQENALSLCTEKVLLAKQAYDLVILLSSRFFVLLLLSLTAVQQCGSFRR